MKSRKVLKGALALAALSMVAAACGDDKEATTTTVAPVESTMDTMAPETTMGEEMVSSAEICDADAIVAAVEGGDEEGTLAGMTDDPVATAASNNPVLTTLVTAVGAAGLGDTLNGAEALGFDDSLGSLEPGKRPGILLLQGMEPDWILGKDASIQRLA